MRSGLIFLLACAAVLGAGLVRPGIVLAQEPGVVEALPAERETVLTGYTRARYFMDIISEESGRCDKVTADVGDAIGPSSVFAVLDTTFIDLDIQENKAAQDEIVNLREFRAMQEQRYENLVQAQNEAQSVLDEWEYRLDESEINLAQLKLQEAELKERKKRFTIQVPAGWRIISRAVEPGEWIKAGDLLGRAGDYSRLLVPFAFTPEEYGRVADNKKPISLHFPDVGPKGTTVRADVARVSPAFDPETRKINVDLGVAKGLPEMRGGLRAELTLLLPDPSGAVLLPASALTERYEESWLTRENGEEVRVVVLGKGPEGLKRVRSEQVKAGDRFLIQSEK